MAVCGPINDPNAENIGEVFAGGGAKGLMSFFLDPRLDVGITGSWADNGFINETPVALYTRSATEKGVFQHYARSSYLFSDFDPVLSFAIYSEDAPSLGNGIRWQLEARYMQPGDSTAIAPAETILQTQTLLFLTADAYQGFVQFTLDRTLMANGDLMQFVLSRIGGDAADTYNDDIGVGQSGITLETKIFNP